MAIVGAFARIENKSFQTTRAELQTLPGVTPFDLDDPDKLGVLVEADDLNAAHSLITGDIRHTPGVLGVWPVYAHNESDFENSKFPAH